MGIIVSWINTIWSNSNPQLTDKHDRLPDSDPHIRPPYCVDNATDEDVHLDELIPLTDSASSSAPLLEPSTTISPPPTPSSSLSPDNSQLLFVSSDYDERARPVVMADAEAGTDTDIGSNLLTPSASPPPPTNPGLRINVAAANDPAMDREIAMVDADFVRADMVPDPAADLYFDDEGLSALEKIYLFARSNASFHRVFIARSLPIFLPDVAPCDAVEYVIPLMNGLAMDEDEAVKEALVEDLVSSIWWFLTHCQVVDFEVPEESEPREVPWLYAQSFTPLLGTLLLNPSSQVGAPARRCVVNLLTRIRKPDAQGDVTGTFGLEERRLFERELLQQVVVGMAHLDGNGNHNANDAGECSSTAHVLHPESLADDDTPHVSLADPLHSPPPSASDDEMMVSTLMSAAQPLATARILAEQDEPDSPREALAVSIQRPPSPIPTSAYPGHMPPLSEIEPEFAHLVSRSQSMPMPLSEPPKTVSPMADVRPTLEWDAVSARLLESVQGHVISDDSQQELVAPQPQPLLELTAPARTGEAPLSQFGSDVGEVCNDFNEEQAAIGRLASMSLMAAVTASGPLDQESQLAFVKEIKRAAHDSIYWVRREATYALGALAKVVPKEILYLTLLPLFASFCEDAIWNVRQSVLFALPAILSRLPFDSRRTYALRTIQKLSVDPAPQVRTGVLEVLGEVVYSFHEDDKGPPDEIVRLFIGEEGRDWHTPDSPIFEALDNVQSRNPWANSAFRTRFAAAASSNETFGHSPRLSSSSSFHHILETDPARPLVCAFNLPAVALTLGPARWFELRGLYHFLARTGASKVRQTLAASIGEVARIIGPEQTRRDLMYRWWDFARGRDAAVRGKALEALEVFLQMLDPPEQERLVGSLEEIWDNHLIGWREREVLARRLGRLTPFFLPNNCEALQMMLRKALRDNTAAVRNVAVEAFPQVYDCISTYPETLRSVIDEVLSLVYDQSYKKRLTYVECAKSLITHYSYPERIMDENFWQSAVALASDQIVDVRISVARLMDIACDKVVLQSRTLPAGVLDIVRSLSEDPASDVRAFVSHILARDVYHLSEKDVHGQGYTAATSPTLAIFSRPPSKRHSRTVDAGIGKLNIPDVHRGCQDN